MSTAVTSDRIQRLEEARGEEYRTDAWSEITELPLNRLKRSFLSTGGDEGVISDELAPSRKDECTYETDETYEIDEIGETEEVEEAQETQETEALEEKEELTTLGPKLFLRIDEAISECRVSGNRDTNRPLFMLAHTLRSIEEELNVHFSMDVIAETIHRWKDQNGVI
jgi:hypothetical protein